MNSSAPIRNWCILVADDHDIVRFGVTQLLTTHFPACKMLNAAHFDQALSVLSKEPIDLVVLDINIPGGDSLSMIERIHNKRPTVKILLFSSYNEHIYALPYMRAGADGYVAKSASQQMLIDAVMNVLNGKKHLSPEMQQASLGFLLQPGSGSKSGLDDLTSRELEVARFLSKGLTTRQIGEKLSLSNSAVTMYRVKVFQKLGVGNVIDLFNFIRLHESGA